MTEYKLTIQAAQDLEDAYEYLYGKNQDAALKLLNALSSTNLLRIYEVCPNTITQFSIGKQNMTF